MPDSVPPRPKAAVMTASRVRSRHPNPPPWCDAGMSGAAEPEAWRAHLAAGPARAALDLLVADIALIEDRYAAFWHPANDGAGRSDKPSTPCFELKGRKLRDIRQRGDCCQAAPDTPSNNGAGSWCPARHSLDWLGFWGILLAIAARRRLDWSKSCASRSASL